MDKAPERSRPLPVNDPDPQDTRAPALVEILLEDRSGLAGFELVKVKNAVNKSADEVADWVDKGGEDAEPEPEPAKG